MAKKILIGMLALTFVMMAAGGCKGDSEEEVGGGGTTTGGLTVTDIPAKYNGLYAFLTFVEMENEEDGFAVGHKSFDPATGIMTLPQISNGRVTIPLWTIRGLESFYPTEVAFF